MRLFLSTFAVMAISATSMSPAFAADMDRDPEGSIEQSNTIANHPDPMMNPAYGVSNMEPAAGMDMVKTEPTQTRMMRYEPITKADAPKPHRNIVKQPTPMEYKQLDKLDQSHRTFQENRDIE